MLQYQKNRCLSEFSTFGIGGPIALFVQVSTSEEMIEAFQNPLPKLVIGKGSNCLFSDQGFQGLVILNKIDFCHWNENEVFVGSGYPFSLLGVQSARKGFSGLEFASGIPATVGGAIYMNAGANGVETFHNLKSVEYFDGKKVSTFSKEELEFSYRSSSFQKMDGAILGATFILKKSDEARKEQLKIVEIRMKTQPLKERSVGCVFRNPLNQSAGKLIDQCGLKGFQVGDAKVSQVHANFIVNSGKASAKEVKELIALVQEKVFQQTGILLETEVRIFDAEHFSG